MIWIIWVGLTIDQNIKIKFNRKQERVKYFIFRKICLDDSKFNTRFANRLCETYLVRQIIHDLNNLSVFENMTKINLAHINKRIVQINFFRLWKIRLHIPICRLFGINHYWHFIKDNLWKHFNHVTFSWRKNSNIESKLC